MTTVKMFLRLFTAILVAPILLAWTTGADRADDHIVTGKFFEKKYLPKWNVACDTETCLMWKK